MYLDLDRLDMRVQDDNGPFGVQTDHREAGEIQAHPELSTVMMLTRVLNAQRGSKPVDRVRLAMMHPSPEWFVELACAAGAEVEEEDSGRVHPAAVDPERVLQAASAALISMGKASFERNRLSADGAGLEKLQHQIGVRVGAMGGKEDKEAYWSAVLELGAATGWVLVNSYGHSWVPDPKFFGTIPFMCGQDSSLSNVFDKVERFFRDGPSEAPTFLLSLAQDASLPDGLVMFNLRPHNWAGLETASCAPILEGDTPVPLLALVRDTPNSVRSMGKDLEGEELKSLKAQALANLSQVPFELQELSLQGGTALVLEGDYYAAEKLFDPDFVLGLHARLDSELLLVGIPAKGQALILPRGIDPAYALALIERQYQDTEPRNQISRLLFMFSAGKLVGLAKAEEEEVEEEDMPEKKGFFARLFGAN
ncbi:MAG: hypothetical protein ACI9VR_001062 [Cognaticolwellia sp.]|jgi:hypothetical protein